MKRIVICMIVVLLLCGCSKSSNTVVLDSWWNTDYARNTCESVATWYKQNQPLVSQVGCSNVTSCQEQMPAVEACRFDPTGGVATFENVVATEFATNPLCHGVNFVKFSGPEHRRNTDSQFTAKSWSLSLNFRPGTKAQSWALLRRGTHDTYAEGSGSAKEIVSKVCAVMTAQGASVAN
jgi:hypothetical protein